MNDIFLELLSVHGRLRRRLHQDAVQQERQPGDLLQRVLPSVDDQVKHCRKTTEIRCHGHKHLNILI